MARGAARGRRRRVRRAPRAPAPDPGDRRRAVKTDAVDARALAHLLRTGLLPAAYIAPPELCDLRDLLRHRATLVHLRTSIKNRVHALSARQGILPEFSHLFGTAGRGYLADLALPEGPRRRLDSLIALIGDFDREITET